MKLCGRLIATALAGVMLLASIGCGSPEFDYETSDLTPYVEIASNLYKGQKLTIAPIDEVDDAYVDEYIRTNVIAPNNKSIYLTDKDVKEGDVIALYYRALVQNEDGTKKELYSNFGDQSPKAYDLAANELKFGEEFSSYIVDYAPLHCKLEQRATGKVKDTDEVIYATYSYSYLISKDGESKKYKTVVKDTATRLELAELDALYGEGFTSNLVDKNIGASFTFKTSFDATGDGVAEDVTFDMTVSHVSIEVPMSFTLTYGDDCEDEALRGKTVEFFVCINGVRGTARELLTEEFLKDTVKYELSEEDKEADKSMIDAFLEEVKESLLEQRKLSLQAAVTSAVFQKIYKEVKFKKLPEEKVDEIYDTMEAEARYYYENYNEQVGASSLNAFIIAYYGLETDTDYKEYFKTTAETSVKEWLIFYTIARAEGIKVTDAEYEEEYDSYIAQMIYNETYAYYAQTGQYVTITEKDLLNKYGKEYIEASIRQSILEGKLQEFLYEQNTYEMKEETEEEKEEAETGAAQTDAAS